jgi:hypothetical protein
MEDLQQNFELEGEDFQEIWEQYNDGYHNNN